MKRKRPSEKEQPKGKTKVKVPNPPKSLITLLQKDKSVLTYFTALQQSLDNDVQEWKKKALDYRSRWKSLQAKIDKRGDGGEEEVVGEEKVVKGVEVDFGRTNGFKKKQCQSFDKSPPLSTIELRPDKEHDDDDDENDDLLMFETGFIKGNKDTSNKTTMNFINESSVAGEHKEHKLGQVNTSSNLDQKKNARRDTDQMKQINNVEDDDMGLFDDLPSSKGSSSSDEDDDGDDSFMNELQSKMKQESNEEEKRIYLKNSFNHITTAYRTLTQSLGVSLIDVYEVKESNDEYQARVQQEGVNLSFHNQDEIFEPLIKHVEKVRRSDVAIVTDLMRTLRELIRAPSLEMTNMLGSVSNDNDIDLLTKLFQPFSPINYHPSCYEFDYEKITSNEIFISLSSETKIDQIRSQHPLVQGLHSICYVLAMMDLFCSSNSAFVQHDEWNSFVDMTTHIDITIDREEIEDMKLGLHGRNITFLILNSLHSEILSWAETDRSARSTSASLKYISDECVDGISESEISDIESDKCDDQDRSGNRLYSFSSKNQNRMFLLMERISLARIVSFLYQYQSDLQGAAKVVIEYVLANTPNQIESYPRYSPTLSLCVLEALLLPISELKTMMCPGYKVSPSVLSSYKSWFETFLLDATSTSGETSTLSNALSNSILKAVDIWKQRKDSKDQRIKEMSEVELSAFFRFQAAEKNWLNNYHKFRSGSELLEDSIDKCFKGSNGISCTSLLLPIQLSLQLCGDFNFAIATLQQLIQHCNPMQQQLRYPIWPMLVAFFNGCVFGIQHLRWENSCISDMGSMERINSDIIDDERLTSIIDQMMILFQQLSNQETKSIKQNSEWLHYFGLTILKCCLVMSDGIRASKVASLVLPNLCSTIGKFKSKDRLYNFIFDFAETPVVRIVNLKCRPDRWKNSITQLQRHQLFAVLSVANICLVSTDYEKNDEDDNMYWGNHAYSGINCNHLEFEQHISQILEKNFNIETKKKIVDDYVASHWRPKDLKAFDRFARDDDELVKISVSERACAFSHVSSWYGIHNTLSTMQRDNNDDGYCYGVDEDYLAKLFRISGFARGQPLLAENNDMPPNPVCIVFEDDALLVDRFRDRLGSLLDELPRDFHYCSLGYSRPKTAPMVPFSSQLSIPTCLWYCTGYILSLEGAKYLIDNLPVVGPVDSWIALKMTSNWENSFGERIGLGNVTKANIDKEMLPPRKDLGVIMKFRAFAAFTPLCSQKLKWSTASAAPSTQARGAKWRDRDTDVTYSGRL